ncbi:hypothetical protein GCM10020295_72520 [Streptomyces cinereospinus]
MDPAAGQSVGGEPVQRVPPAPLGPPGEVYDLALLGALPDQRDTLGERRIRRGGGEEAVPVAGLAPEEVLPVGGVREGVVQVEHGDRPFVTSCHTGHPSAAAGSVRPWRSGVRCVLSAGRPEALVRGVLGLPSGAARVRAGRRAGANVACRGPRG